MEKNEERFYDISAIRRLPILSVAEHLGLTTDKRGENYWCQVRQDSPASVALHPDLNSFYDFDTMTHGDPIRFTEFVKQISRSESISFLGKSFGLKPTLSYDDLLNLPLSNWEYHKIGLHGDLAAKNFGFPLDERAIQNLQQLEQSPGISLNEVQTQLPVIYRDIVQQKAVPYVERLRNRFHRNILTNTYSFFSSDGSDLVLHVDDMQNQFAKASADLNRIEHILYRAERNAGFAVSEPVRHDPVSVVQQLRQGTLSVALGNVSQEDLISMVKQRNLSILSASVPLSKYLDPQLQRCSHTAEYSAGKVTLQYLSSDKELFKSIVFAVPQKSVQQEYISAGQGSVSHNSSKNELSK